MFYQLKVQDHIRVPPDQFDKDLTEAIFGEIRKKYDGYISKNVGIVLDVVSVEEVGEGSIIAAGALVPMGKVIPPRSLVLGSPGKIVRQVTDDELAKLIDSAQRYVGYAKRHLGAP